jgi:hypothetical protein
MPLKLLISSSANSMRTPVEEPAMLKSRLLNRSVVVAVAVAAGALLAPAATNPASATPPCCGIDLVYTYYATAAMTGPAVGQSDESDCPFNDWGQVTQYVKVSRIYCATNP